MHKVIKVLFSQQAPVLSKEKRINAFISLGKKIESLSPEEREEIGFRARSKNQWFTPEMVDKALKGVTLLLEPEPLREWAGRYTEIVKPQVVGIVMAGNIPLVGFHDLLTVLISGHIAQIKLSSQDDYLPRLLLDWLVELEPEMSDSIQVADKLKNMDAVIATGSDNSARYFHQYFDHLPNIIRKNRTSVGIIRGDEQEKELTPIGEDILTYFGLGCRNVSKIYVPDGYDLPLLLDSLQGYEEVLNHHKYQNNYDYNKSIYLVNRVPHLDTGFMLFRESGDLVSPLSVVYHESYSSLDDLESKLELNRDKLQCTVSAGGWYEGSFAFGEAQYPRVDDYADGVDTMAFLSNL